jgi:hypothetical protein
VKGKVYGCYGRMVIYTPYSVNAITFLPIDPRCFTFGYGTRSRPSETVRKLPPLLVDTCR